MSSLKHTVGKVIQVIVPETEPLTNEEMARMMRPLLRVMRGKDWPQSGPGSQRDGNSAGTVVGKCPDYSNSWLVRWDKTGETHSQLMGSLRTHQYYTDPQYHLKILQTEVIH
jgi:hypothetical protein